MGTGQELAGLEVGNYAVKVAQLGGKPHKVRLKVLDREILPATESQADKDLAALAAIKRLYKRNEIGSKQVAVSVVSPATAVKRMQVPKVAPHLLREAVLWEAEQYLPFDPADFQLDFQLLPEGKNSPYHQLLLVAAPKAAIEQAAQLVRQAGLQPVIVDVPALALENQYALNYARETAQRVCLLDIGAHSTLINILSAGSTVLAHSLSLGGDNYTRVIQDQLGVDYTEAESIKQQPGNLSKELQAALQVVSSQLGQELKRLLDYSKPALNGLEVEKIFLSGGGCLINGLADCLQTSLAKPVFFLDPLKAIRFKKVDFPAQTLRPYLASTAIAVGLGLRGMNF